MYALSLLAATTQDWWQVLLADLLQAFVVIAVPVISTLVAVLLRRWKINLEADQVEKVAAKAAGWAEQKALSALKEGKPKTSAAEKMSLALDFGNEMVDKYKLKSSAVSKLEHLIEAHLGSKKLEKKENA